ncbi:glycine--tRNA ligase subunit beta [Desulfosudis oleivorans]|uniref:Glycine--tRNA ligase beta subunit n=1 Tax=Desulfosudis oleivorans (strain DSM 6200 / JCM 39069 / Hxd3) TaxID=96561 RepID=A9A0L6_DESOH|nr:glycine--tRNA ligase subunit beta [Desulfosudis oleivorans]ABW67516.1 glycyl-tRNA synthetase, beta subunit [Desulfosudis oleivorans Hxd3]
MKNDTLLFEIGTEELPAGYIEPALAALANTLVRKLTEARVACGTARTFGTPRRLAVIIEDVAGKQETVTTELTGPPRSVGMDENGRFTLAAKKFAEKAGVALKAVKVVRTEKGEYLAARKVEKGVLTSRILKTVLPQVITSLPFPKTMKWADRNETFARPVHSLTVLLGKSVVRLSWAGISSNRNCMGHSFMHPAPVSISHPDAYVEQMRRHFVLVDTAERKAAVRREIGQAAIALGGELLPDEELVDVVTNLVEYPVASAGRFDEKFLALPKEVLITSMRSHQKYFAVTDKKKNLMPCFVAVNNTKVSDIDVVTTGHQRVLRARLEDAMFFYQKDLQAPLDQRVPDLARVVFQARLGTLLEKTQRIEQLGLMLAGQADPGNTATGQTVVRAATLCKADLVTHTVIEFPKLQGVMGRVFARASGEPEAVARAIEEHYQPLYAGADLPESLAGALLAVADKIDSICGCFAVGLVPSGASDPYALRRQGIGLIQILLSHNIGASLSRIIQAAMAPFASVSTEPVQAAADGVSLFLRGRMAQMLVDDGVPRDVATAVLNASADHVPDAWKRSRALAAVKPLPDFEPIAAAFKRVANIIKKADPKEIAGEVNSDLFEAPAESTLLDACQAVKIKMDDALARQDYSRALTEIADLRSVVDTFFDEVLVMAKDSGRRRNRLALLSRVNSLFKGFADFSALSTEQATGR